MKIMKAKKAIMIIFILLFTLTCNNSNTLQGTSMSTPDTLSIKIILEDTTLTATMDNNPTTQDFIALLPLELTLDDYAGTEKVSTLPQQLSTKDAPAGYKASVGDITYYSPWGNLAIFYKNFSYAHGLIKLGTINQGMEELTKTKSQQVRIELNEK